MADDVNAIDLHVVEQLGQIIGHLLIGESPPGDHVGCRTFPVNVNFAGTLRCRSCAFRAALRPRKKAGRKPDEATARAAEMWSAGIKRGNQRDLWQRIYGEVFSDFHRMDKLTRQHRTHTLRRNVKAYLRRQGHKSARGIHVTTRMRARKRVLFPPTAAPAE